MSEPFDPYSQWLGIEPHEMPADHYRLLCIRRFERDPAVIAAAADERMARVRTYQTGPRAAYTQKLLNELSAARVCLLNPGAKASYDQVLEAVFFSSAPPPQFAAIAIPPIADDDELDDDFVEPASTAWIAIATVIVVLLAGAIAILALRQQQPKSTVVPVNPPPPFRINELSPVEPDAEREPVLIYQEGDGSVNLDAAVAQLHGPTLQLAISGGVNVIDDWESMDDWVSWRFKLVTVPPQGIFHVHITYAARPESDGGKFLIAVGDKEKECEIRGTGEPITDEYFIAIPNSGEHTLTIRATSKPSQRLMTLKSLTLRFP